jgi:hypothetical protein
VAHLQELGYTDELWFIALRLPGGVEGYFERLSPRLRQAGVRHRTPSPRSPYVPHRVRRRQHSALFAIQPTFA